MRPNGRSRDIARALAIPGIALLALGAAGFVSGLLSPSSTTVCAEWCSWTPLRESGTSLEIVAIGAVLLAASLVIARPATKGRRTRAAFGLIGLVLGGITLEANLSYLLFADSFFGEVVYRPNVVELVLAGLNVTIFGTASLAFLAVGATNWWGGGGSGPPRRAGPPPDVRVWLYEGILLAGSGAVNALLSVEFAGCVTFGMGACQSQPLVPIAYPLAAYVTGLGVIAMAVWAPALHRRRRRHVDAGVAG